MKQMLLSLLSREQREAVMPYVTTARVKENNTITVEPSGKEFLDVSPPEAGELLAHDVIALLCEETTPGVYKPPVVPFAWLCLAEHGLEDPSVGILLDSAEFTLAHEWSSRVPRRPRARALKSIRRANPPAVVILAGEETPVSGAVAHRLAEAFVRQRMVSPYAEQSIVRGLSDNPGWLLDEKRTNPHALNHLQRLVARDMSEGNVQSHAVVVFDADDVPQPVEESIDTILALTCMSEEAQHHPTLQGHRNNLFTVVVEKPEPTE